MIYKYSKDNYMLSIDYDDDPINPRENNNLGKMACWHRRYNLGDKNPYENPSDFLTEAKKKKFSIVKKLYLLDHSGLTVSTQDFNDKWDSGPVGFIYCTKQDIIKEYGKCDTETLKLADQRLESEVKEYDSYLQGDQIMFKITDSSDKVIESVGGLYSDKKEIKFVKSLKDYVSDEYHYLFDGLIGELEKDSKHNSNLETEM